MGGSSRDRPIHVVVVAVGVVTIVIAVIVVVAIIVVVIMIIIILIIIMKPRGRLRFEGGPRTFAFRGVRPTAPFGVKEGGRTCTFYVIFNVFLVTNSILGGNIVDRHGSCLLARQGKDMENNSAT